MPINLVIQNIKNRLLELDKSEEDLADFLGINRSNVNKMFNQKAGLKVDRLLKIAEFVETDPVKLFQKLIKVPVISYVSAGDPFEWTDQGYASGDGFDFIDLPPGVDYHPNLYAVRIKGDSMRPWLKDGTTLIVKPESREDIAHEDIVVWKDENYNAWVKMVLFHENQIVFRSLNSQYPDITKKFDEIILMDLVIATVR